MFYHLLDLLETTPDPWGYCGEVPHGVGSTLDPIQCHFWWENYCWFTSTTGINFGQFDWFFMVSYHLLDLLETTPDPWGYCGKGTKGDGRLQTLSIMILDEKTAGNIICYLISFSGHFDWSSVVSYHIMKPWRLAQTSGGLLGRVPRVLSPVQTQGNGVFNEKIDKTTSDTFYKFLAVFTCF